ncbi:transposable element gene, partial [Prunus dulcis]
AAYHSLYPAAKRVAERKNRTIMNMVRSMLSGKEVPKEFWPEASHSCCKDVTPEEAWSGIKPCVDHFRVFGCVAHVHVPDSRRKKLDNKSFKCVLLGVSEESKAYRLYDPISKKIVISRDIVSAYEVKRDVLEWEGDNEDANANEEGEGLEDEQTEEIDNSSPNESSEEHH